MEDVQYQTTPIIDLSKIKHVPVTIWSGVLDTVCYNA